MDFRKQEDPFCVQVELTLGCNLQCHFCGINGIQDRPRENLRMMSLDTAQKVAESIAAAGWSSRIEFARRGEPTLNPNAEEIIGVFRKELPKSQLMLTTNGAGLMTGGDPVGNIKALFGAGLNLLALDEYQNIGFVPKVRFAWDAEGEPDVKVFEYPANPDGNPHHRYPLRDRRLVFVADIVSEDKGVHSILNNHAGHAGELDLGYQKRCAKVFREFSVNWDGSVDICCIDWASEYTLGNVHSTSVVDLWQGPRLNAARAYLYQGQRDALRPCRGCNHNFYRAGLLPDKKGKETLPLPNEECSEIVYGVLSEGPKNRVTDKVRSRILSVLSEDEKEAWRWKI